MEYSSLEVRVCGCIHAVIFLLLEQASFVDVDARVIHRLCGLMVLCKYVFLHAKLPLCSGSILKSYAQGQSRLVPYTLPLFPARLWLEMWATSKAGAPYIQAGRECCSCCIPDTRISFYAVAQIAVDVLPNLPILSFGGIFRQQGLHPRHQIGYAEGLCLYLVHAGLQCSVYLFASGVGGDGDDGDVAGDFA